MLQDFQNFIKSNNLIKEDETVLLGISGGIDSCVMLDLFLKSNYKFAIAHCNFNLRENDSLLDYEFVKSISEKHNICFYSTLFNTKEYSKINGISIEMAARDLRYSWFEQICIENSYKKIAIAHNKNDNVETFFLNLTRRTGLKGLSGIKVKHKNIIRPLLFATRETIEVYAHENKISWREDISNQSDIYRRNTIRHKIIPVFQEFDIDFIPHMNGNIEKFKESYLVFSKEIKRKRRKCIVSENELIEFSISALKKLKPLRTYLFEFFCEYGFNESQVDDIINLLNSQPGKYIVSKNNILLKDRDSLIIKPLSEIQKTSFEIKELNNITEPIKLNFSLDANDNVYSKSPYEACIDFDKIKLPLTIRKWKKGDIFAPIGMKGKKKKISDFLTDLKLNKFQKENIWVLSSEDEIVWVIGFRISDNYKLTNDSIKKLIIRYIH